MRRLTIALALICVASAAHADDALLKRLVGDWIGRGTLQLKTSEAPERLYCKITNTLTADGTGLRQSGRCALPTNSLAIEIDLRALGAGRYSGSAGRRGRHAFATLSGTGSTNRLVLTATTTGEKPSTATATIEIGIDGFRLRTTKVDSKTATTHTLGEVIFLPQ